jgi:hypothetical protein
MKVLIVAYIISESLMDKLEAIVSFDGFQKIESNTSFRVFAGRPRHHAVAYFRQLFQQLDGFEFDIEDSLFMAYPSVNGNKSSAISTLVLKRKGNKHLRKQENR